MDLTDVKQSRQRAREALEDYAREVFDFNNVAYRILRASKAGRQSVHVPQDRPVDLSGTDAAAQLVIRLEELGYATSWEDTFRNEAASRQDTGRDITYCELVIEWHTRLFLD